MVLKEVIRDKNAFIYLLQETRQNAKVVFSMHIFPSEQFRDRVTCQGHLTNFKVKVIFVLQNEKAGHFNNWIAIIKVSNSNNLVFDPLNGWPDGPGFSGTLFSNYKGPGIFGQNFSTNLLKHQD